MKLSSIFALNSSVLSVLAFSLFIMGCEGLFHDVGDMSYSIDDSSENVNDDNNVNNLNEDCEEFINDDAECSSCNGAISGKIRCENGNVICDLDPGQCCHDGEAYQSGDEIQDADDGSCLVCDPANIGNEWSESDDCENENNGGDEVTRPFEQCEAQGDPCRGQSSDGDYLEGVCQDAGIGIVCIFGCYEDARCPFMHETGHTSECYSSSNPEEEGFCWIECTPDDGCPDPLTCMAEGGEGLLGICVEQEST